MSENKKINLSALSSQYQKDENITANTSSLEAESSLSEENLKNSTENDAVKTPETSSPSVKISLWNIKSPQENEKQDTEKPQTSKNSVKNDTAENTQHKEKIQNTSGAPSPLSLSKKWSTSTDNQDAPQQETPKEKFDNYESSFEKQSNKIKHRLKHFEYKKYTPLRAWFTIAFCLTVIFWGVTVSWQNGYIPEKYTASIMRMYSESENAQEIVNTLSDTASQIGEQTRGILWVSLYSKHEKLKDHLIEKHKQEQEEIKKQKIKDHLIATYSS